jgi:uncharacterized membrane protein YeaQ/YmgE (transglycosylase-associated protein family)
MKTWLKGGVIGLVIGVVSSLLEISCISTCDGFGCIPCGFLAIIGALLSYPISWIVGTPSDNYLFFFIFPIFNIIGWIILCAFIGWIIGKIKNKK